MSGHSLRGFLSRRRISRRVRRLERCRGLCFVRCGEPHLRLEQIAAKRGAHVPPHIHDFLDRKLSHLQEKADGLSGAARAFIGEVAALPPLGVFTPLEHRWAGHALEWYYVFAWVRHWTGLVTPRESEIPAGDPSLVDVPAPYAAALTCFDQIPFFLVPGGFMGPSPGFMLGSSAERLSLIKKSIDVHIEAGGLLPSEALRAEEIEDLLPILADGSGNYYIHRRGSTQLSFFDHEDGIVKETGTKLEDLLRTFWTTPGEWL